MLPQAPPNILSDTEDDTASESSLIDTDDESRLTMDFDEPEGDFAMNGDVQSFINGDIEENDEISVFPPSNGQNYLLGVPYNHIFHHPHFPPQPQPPPYPPPPLTNQPIQQPAGIAILAVNGSMPAPVVPAPAIPSPVIPTTPLLTFSTNDMNDAQEISKILQQSCQVNQQNGASDNSDSLVDDVEPIKEEKEEKEEKVYSNGIVSEFNNCKLNSCLNSHSGEEDEENESQEEDVRTQNIAVRKIVFADIRRPGRDYSQLLEHLATVKGNFTTKFSFVQMCIEESLRFRRHQMAKCIREWWEKNCDANGTNS
jgi:integrator complex subunit 6